MRRGRCEQRRAFGVRGFASAVAMALGHDAIDAIVLNAGMQFADVKHRTEDGFETAFAVNHLAHFLLLRLFMPRLEHGATVVMACEPCAEREPGIEGDDLELALSRERRRRKAARGAVSRP